MHHADNDNKPIAYYTLSWEPGMKVPYGYYRSVVQPDMIFKCRWADDDIEEVEQETGYDPDVFAAIQFTAEVRRAVSKLIKAGKIREAFEKRQSIGNAWYDEQARINGYYGTDFYPPAIKFRRDIEAVVLGIKEAA